MREVSEGRQTVFPREPLSREDERGPSTVLGAGPATAAAAESELGDWRAGGKCGEEEEVGGRKG